jgi:hypothetical protein
MGLVSIKKITFAAILHIKKLNDKYGGKDNIK